MAVKRCATATREMAKKWDVHAVNQAKKDAMSQIVPVFEFHELDIPKAYPNCQTMSKYGCFSTLGYHTRLVSK
jgi:hypothetical protein